MNTIERYTGYIEQHNRIDEVLSKAKEGNMKTYRVLSRDDFGDIDARFDDLDEMKEWVDLFIDPGCKYKVVEEIWQCVSETPFLFIKE